MTGENTQIPGDVGEDLDEMFYLASGCPKCGLEDYHVVVDNTGKMIVLVCKRCKTLFKWGGE